MLFSKDCLKLKKNMFVHKLFIVSNNVLNVCKNLFSLVSNKSESTVSNVYDRNSSKISSSTFGRPKKNYFVDQCYFQQSGV